ncbi:MAG: RNA polymerase sigma factor [Acidobacteriia bacterium]|nr:RNA polymerase sigma factor [Terriglobia bacterium]
MHLADLPDEDLRGDDLQKDVLQKEALQNEGLPRTAVRDDDLRGELERLHPQSFGWALWCCRQRREDAEDVLQTVYLKVLEGRARFDGRSSFQTWLFGVVRNTAAEQRRRRWLRDALLLKWFLNEPEAAALPGPEAALGEAGRNRELRAALAQLPERQREVLHLVFYQELTVEEAAVTLRVSVGTARTHFERGKKRLRLILANEDFSE